MEWCSQKHHEASLGVLALRIVALELPLQLALEVKKKKVTFEA
jgi:hypothetical protein